MRFLLAAISCLSFAACIFSGSAHAGKEPHAPSQQRPTQTAEQTAAATNAQRNTLIARLHLAGMIAPQNAYGTEFYFFHKEPECSFYTDCPGVMASWQAISPAWLAFFIDGLSFAPQTRDYILASLLDESKPPAFRWERLARQTDALFYSLDKLRGADARWRAPFQNFSQFAELSRHWSGEQAQRSAETAEQAAARKNQLAFADPFIAAFLHAMADETAAAPLAQTDDFTSHILLPLWNAQRNEPVRQKALTALSDAAKTPAERMTAARILALLPEATPEKAWSLAAFNADIDTVNTTWLHAGQNDLQAVSLFANTRPEFSQAVLPGILAMPRMLAGGKGKSAVLKQLDAAPDFSAVKLPLYIVTDTPAHALGNPLSWPAECMAYAENESRLVMGGTPYAIFKKGPRILRLDPQRPERERVLQWFRDHGAPSQRALLFASNDKPSRVRARIASWHAQLRQNGTDKPAAMFARPTQSAFLLWLASELKGESAALLAGQNDTIWFADNATATPVWHEIQGYKGAPALKKLPLVLEFSSAQLANASAQSNGAALSANTETPKESRQP